MLRKNATATIGLLLLGLFPGLTSTSARADTVSGGAASSWRPWVSSNLDEDGKPYWDTPSFDGFHESIGYILTGQSPTSMTGAPGAIPFWGQSYDNLNDTGGGPDANFFFNRTAPATAATFKLEISARSGVNEFGWYNVASTSILNPIFTASDSAGAQETIMLSAQYGFYVKTLGGAVFRTQSSLNPAAETGHQHFAVFQQTGTPSSEAYWLGVEDLTLAELGSGEGGIGDYNDMVVKLVAVPEPTTGLLLGAGIALTLSLLAWKKRAS